MTRYEKTISWKTGWNVFIPRSTGFPSAGAGSSRLRTVQPSEHAALGQRLESPGQLQREENSPRSRSESDLGMRGYPFVKLVAAMEILFANFGDKTMTRKEFLQFGSAMAKTILRYAEERK